MEEGGEEEDGEREEEGRVRIMNREDHERKSVIGSWRGCNIINDLELLPHVGIVRQEWLPGVATEAFQSHLCSTYRGLWGLVVVRLS